MAAATTAECRSPGAAVNGQRPGTSDPCACSHLPDFTAELMAHDLRTPLNVVFMAAELLAMDAASMSARERSHWLHTISQAAQRMNSMIGDFLERSRARTDAVLPMRRQSILPVMLEARDAHQLLARKAGVMLRLDTGWRDIVANINRPALLRVLDNLLDNAIRSTPRGGRIVLRAREHSGLVRVSVSDSGTGIRREHLPRLFDPHWQGGEKRGSAGLGLVVVKSVVEQHGGRVHVRSAPGVGTCFSLRLPH